MTFVGMTTDQIDASAQSLRAQAHELQSVRSRINGLVHEASAHWEGKDVHSFRSLWTGTYQNRIAATIARLNSMADHLTRQASDQRVTSQADLGGTPGKAFGLTPTLPPESPAPPPPVPGSAEDMEQQLRDAGLLDGETNELYDEWLKRAADRGVSVEEILKIAREHGITPEDFAVMEGWEVIVDPDGKMFFVLPPGTSGEDAKKAVLMTYIINGGTDYDAADDSPQNQGGSKNDFAETPYSSDEIARIAGRQEKNDWSYHNPLFHQLGDGVLVTTPNGMLMGFGGDGVVDFYSMSGGTTYGDVFIVNIDSSVDPTGLMRDIVTSGSRPYASGNWGDGTGGTGTDIDLDRLLHHEEIHSQQWEDDGVWSYPGKYIGQQILAGGDGTKVPYEQGAGLHDGGYA